MNCFALSELMDRVAAGGLDEQWVAGSRGSLAGALGAAFARWKNRPQRGIRNFNQLHSRRRRTIVCCGQARSNLRANGTANQAALKLMLLRIRFGECVRAVYRPALSVFAAASGTDGGCAGCGIDPENPAVQADTMIKESISGANFQDPQRNAAPSARSACASGNIAPFQLLRSPWRCYTCALKGMRSQSWNFAPSMLPTSTAFAREIGRHRSILSATSPRFCN